MNVLAWCLGPALFLCECSRTPAQASLGDPPAEPAPLPATDGGASGTRKIAEATPEIVTKAADILRENPGAEMGTEFPFEIAGRRYVARVEEHDNPNGDPQRPQGRHKGITVYSTD